MQAAVENQNLARAEEKETAELSHQHRVGLPWRLGSL